MFSGEITERSVGVDDMPFIRILTAFPSTEFTFWSITCILGKCSNAANALLYCSFSMLVSLYSFLSANLLTMLVVITTSSNCMASSAKIISPRSMD